MLWLVKTYIMRYKMKKFLYFFITLSIALPPAMAELKDVVSSPLTVLSASDYESTAKHAFNNIPNKADPQFLDLLLQLYPNAPIAPVAFTLRFRGVQLSRSISDYHEFIEKYDQTLAAHQALYEVFDLYRASADSVSLADGISFYLDFLSRYPNSPPAILAKLEIESRSFQMIGELDKEQDNAIKVLDKQLSEKITDNNTIDRLIQQIDQIETEVLESYEVFINAFPNTAQVAAAEERQKIWAVKAEKLRQKGELKKRDKDKESIYLYERAQELLNEHNKEDEKITALIKELGLLGKNVNKKHLKKQLKHIVEDKVLKAKLQQLRKKERLTHRITYVLDDKELLYKKKMDRTKLHTEKRHRELLSELASIITTIIFSNEKLIGVLKTEFDLTRKTLEAGFRRLIDDNKTLRQVLRNGFADLKQGMNQLHKDLVKVNDQLKNIYSTVSDVKQAVDKTNKQLGVLHKDLNNIHGAIVEMNKDMNQGFSRQQATFVNMQEEFSKGFETLHKDNLAIKGESKKIVTNMKDVVTSIQGVTKEVKIQGKNIVGAINLQTHVIHEDNIRVIYTLERNGYNIVKKLDELKGAVKESHKSKEDYCIIMIPMPTEACSMVEKIRNTNIKENTNQFVESVGNKTKEIVESVGDKTKEVGEEIKEIGEEIVEKVNPKTWFK